jgi:protein disulfide-isomerase A6
MRSVWLLGLLMMALLLTAPCLAEEEEAKEEENPNSDVVTLTEANFDSIVNDDSKNVVIEFYAPWCGHCKSLAPHWEKFATAFKDEPSVVVAKVDATKEAALGKRFGISGYPSIRFFPPANKKGEEQGNFADAEKFIDWMNDKAGTFRAIGGGLKTTAGKVKLLDKIVMGLDEAEGDLKAFATSFAEAIEGLKGHRFENDAKLYVEIAERLASKPGQASDVMNELDSGISSSSDSSERKKLQLMKNVLQSFMGVSHMNSKQLRAFAKEHKIDVSGMAESRDLRKAILKSLPNIEGRLAELAKLKVTIQEFLDGEVKAAEEKAKRREEQKKREEERRMKREKARKEELTAPVKTARDFNFKKLVLDPTKDVLVEFYAPWCGHCKSLAPIFDEVGEHFKDNSDVLVVKLDATAETKAAKKYKVSGYPTLVWFPKSDKTGKLRFSGDRTKEGIIKFLENGGQAATTEEVEEEEEKNPESADPSAEDGVVKLTDDNFDAIALDDTKTVLVEFYAPWCGHCKKIQPTYAAVAKALKDKSDIVIAKIDATEHTKAPAKFDVQGFPTIKIFRKGKKAEPEEYSGSRTKADFIQFVTGEAAPELEAGSSEATVDSDGVTVLTDSNFKGVALDDTKDVLVEFYAPWCGHCKSLVPIYADLAKEVSGKDDIVIAKVDATVHKKVASKYGIKGFPTIKLFPKGGQKPKEYNGGRTKNEFLKFLGVGAKAEGKKKIGEFVEDEL